MLFRFKNRSREHDLRRHEEQVAALVAATPAAVMVVDASGEVLATNAALHDLLALAPTEKNSDGVRAHLHAQDATRFSDALRALLSGDQESVDFPCRWWRAGDVLQCRVRASRLADTTVPMAVVMLDDITATVQAKQSVAELGPALKAQRAATAVLAGATAVSTTLEGAVGALGASGDWDVVLFWSVDPMGSTLRVAYAWHAGAIEAQTFIAAARALILPPSLGLPGRCWDRNSSIWEHDVAACPRSIHTARADASGLRTSLCIPVRVQGRVEGVFELLCRNSRTSQDTYLSALEAIVQQVGCALERIAQEAPLREEVRQYQTLAEMAQEAIITIDEESRIVFANAKAHALFGYEPNELIDQSLAILMPAEMWERHRNGMKHFLTYGRHRVQWSNIEMPGRRKDGTEIRLELSLADIGGSGPRLFSGYLRDITQRKKEESALLRAALHDALTGLPNRNLLQERTTRAILVSQRHGLPLTLLFMDLDRFKDVNDGFGHHYGDELLKQVAERVQRALRESDSVARLGGDEFALLLPSTDERGAILAANRVLQSMKAPFTVSGQQVNMNASIGIAAYPYHGGDTATLMRRADVAMYAAKRATSGWAVYSSDRDELNSVRLLLANELRAAIEGNDLRLHYQPKMNLATGATENVEALVRWQHAERGMMPPDTFIPLAEDTGLIKPLTIWVLNEALRQHRVWREQGLWLRVAVNFSARMLHDPELLDMVHGMLQRWELEPSSLAIEITESAIMVDQTRARETLTQLHKAGVVTSIDDFGTGHSSLAYLRHLPFDEIKIDKSFVLDMATSRDDASIVRSVVALGHNFDLSVVAEGVDNQRTLDMLHTMGCDIAQGFYLSRPVEAEHVVTWLKGRRPKLSQAS